MKKWFYPVSLILLFIILITAVIPDGYVYGSNTDWLSQHVTLAETIRNACLEQHTLLPSWIGLGGGSNGYQFAYYGFLRPDILIGCLLPQIPMVDIIIGYMTAVYLCSVLLVYIWLRSERISPLLAWLGSMLFMTAGCLFHMHRQIMFVNYLPFMLLAFLCIRKQRYKWLPLCLLLICLGCFLQFMLIATRMRAVFYKLIAFGLGLEYIIQVFLTVGGVTKFIPSTGVTLPFVSYGGSSIFSTFILFGVIQGLYILKLNDEEEMEEG